MGDVAKPDRNASSSAMPAMPISDRCRVVCGISPGAEQRSMDNTRARSQKALHARCALLTPADNTKVFRLCDVFTAVTRHRGPAAHMGSRSVAFCVRLQYCLCTLRAIYRARRTVASWGVCAGDCYADWATVGEGGKAAVRGVVGEFAGALACGLWFSRFLEGVAGSFQRAAGGRGPNEHGHFCSVAL